MLLPVCSTGRSHVNNTAPFVSALETDYMRVFTLTFWTQKNLEVVVTAIASPPFLRLIEH
jgi:hypothetical protein